MFKRLALPKLLNWSAQPNHKPLIIRGARQVGKTTLVHQLASHFEQYIYLNLELPSDRKPFIEFNNVDQLLQAVFFLQNKSYDLNRKNLLFIDEIQEVPEALNILRYIYEQAPQLHVIAAGSMLESIFNKDIHFPVGRVSYLMLRPVSFPEFLLALDETAAYEQLEKVPFQAFAHDRLIALFHTYAIVGGMPEVVAQYARHKDLRTLHPIYDSLIASYLDDVEKYARSDSQSIHIRHVIQASFHHAGHRIKFEHFGHSAYKSREMGEALRIAEKALLLHLVYPTTNASLPLIPAINKSPRLQILDTGLLNYRAGVQKDIIGTKDLSSVYQGIITEHIVGQELLAFQFEALSGLSFWVREKNTSMAEVDYIFPFEGKLIPIEVKSGASGTLRSLHLYMDMAPHRMAVRMYAGPLMIHTMTTPAGKSYYLLNLPYFLTSRLEDYLTWFQKQIETGKILP